MLVCLIEFGTLPGMAERNKELVTNLLVHAREHDLCMTHTLLNPQVDRSRPVERQEKDLAAKVVKETDAGIVVSGCGKRRCSESKRNTAPDTTLSPLANADCSLV